MAQSKRQTKILDLGKKLVVELGINKNGDTLGRWMAHYLAEVFNKIENAEAAEKASLEMQAVDLILKIWKHRWTLPHGRRPLENFLPLLNLLEKLDAENDENYFYNQLPVPEKSTKQKLTKREKELNSLLQLAENVDKTARIWLSEILHEAAMMATDDVAKSWLENAVVIPRDYDTKIIVRLITEKDPDLDDKNSMKEFKGRLSKETIQSRVKQLEAFNELNDQLINIYRRQLK